MATKRERKTNDNTRDTGIRTYEGQHNEGPLGGSPRRTFNGRSAGSTSASKRQRTESRRSRGTESVQESLVSKSMGHRFMSCKGGLSQAPEWY